MKTFLCAITLLFAVSLSAAEQAPAKFAGQWMAIVHAGKSKDPNLTGVRSLLTFYVDPQGGVNNGAVRDFEGRLITSFFGQVDQKGRLVCQVMPTASNFDSRLNLRLKNHTGVGTYSVAVYDDGNTYRVNTVSRGTIQCWRETIDLPSDLR